jgi:hypothetical protein
LELLNQPGRAQSPATVKESCTLSIINNQRTDNMQRNIFTRRGRLMLAIVNTAGALFFVACLLVLMLAYFDVLTK